MGEGVNVMDDRRIIGLFLERSEQAIDALSTKYGDLCHHIARNIVGNEQDADECVSDAYLALWDSIPPEKPQFLRAYVTKVLRNIAYDTVEAMSARKRKDDGEICRAVRSAVSNYLYKNTHRSPMVIPMVTKI